MLMAQPSDSAIVLSSMLLFLVLINPMVIHHHALNKY